MSDIHLDNLNNSQLILLVLLISLVVSAATAVATLSVVYERLALTAENANEAQPTVIRQTINRIIEREAVLPATTPIATGTASPDTQQAAVTLDTVEQSLVLLHFGSQPAAQGIYVSADGHILTAEVLDIRRRYSVLDEIGTPVFFSVVRSDRNYSLLAPVATHNPEHFVPLEQSTNTILLGQTVLLYSGVGDNAQLHTGIISQKKSMPNNTTAIRISVNASDIDTLSVVFIEDAFAGFARPYAQWITLPTNDLIGQITQPEAPSAGTESPTAEIQQ